MSNIDKIRQEIERLKEEYNKQISAGLISESLVSMGKVEALNKILVFIESIQQERQEVDLDADIEMEWDSFKKHLAEYNGESEEVVWLSWNSFTDVARNFYERGLKAK